MGLSLSDQYWIKPYGSEIRWSDVNYFENDFSEAPVEEWMADVGLDSPDNTSDGVLSKRWVCAMASDACSREVRCSIRNPTTRLSPRSFSRAMLSDRRLRSLHADRMGRRAGSFVPDLRQGPTVRFIPATT